MLKKLLISCKMLLAGTAMAQVVPTDTASLSEKVLHLEEVVVSASKRLERVLYSPVSIEKIVLKEMRQTAQPSFYEALENVKGVHLIVPSLGFKVINTRGFANTTNVRFAQLIDGADNQAPHIGSPIGNALGPSDLDILSVELIPGTASALYGMNAVNGLANLLTKNPFEHEGFSFRQQLGFNHLANKEVGAKRFQESSLRYARRIGKKWAFKINTTFTKGYDWQAQDRSDLAAQLNASAGLVGSSNPAYDAVSSYGNESSNRRTLTLAGRSIVVARSGYDEAHVANYRLQNWKSDAAIHFRPRPGQELIYTYRRALLDNIYQRANRFRLEDYLLQQHALSWKGKGFIWRAYLNAEFTGKSYNLRSMAENLDRFYKSDNQWFTDFQTQFRQVISQLPLAEALQAARAYADAGRLTPDTEKFGQQVARLQDINNWDVGAALRVKSRLYHTELQWDVTSDWLKKWAEAKGLSIQIGADHRTYAIVPDGNYFINPVEANRNLTYSKTGGFLQLTQKLLSNKLMLGATLRLDKADYFGLKTNPRLTALYALGRVHSLRASYQSGYRFPSIFEGFSNINSGGVKRVGGLPVMSQGIFEQSYVRASIDAFQAVVNEGVNRLGLAKRDSLIRASVSVLQRNTYTYLRPEFIRSVEFGYRGYWLNQKLWIDADAYFNHYRDFMAQIEANVPIGRVGADSLGYVMIDRNKQQRYRLWTNSQTVVFNYGMSLGLRYQLHNWMLASNITYTYLSRKDINDGLEDGFNTPRWLLNASVSNTNLWQNIGFGLSIKHQSSFFYQSFLVSGTVRAVRVLDGYLSYHLPNRRVDFKWGGTNLLNRYYYSILGGPKIGGFYYLTLTYQ